MKTLGLIGYPLSHSRSPAVFQQLFQEHRLDQFTYRLFPLEELRDFPRLLQEEPSLCGINVTIPYKMSVAGYLDKLDPVAEEIGAVNTILITEKKRKRELTGYNTDAVGFMASATFAGHRNALILGTGGSARAVAYALRQLGISYRFVSRDPVGHGSIGYNDLDKSVMEQATLIINSTPAGMYPNPEGAPDIPYELLTPRHFLYDLVYHPEQTLFLRHGASRGTSTQSGLRMLRLQAEASFQLFLTA